jgi:hypothetical protein
VLPPSGMQIIDNLSVGMFYRKCMLVIDGNYNNDDGLNIIVMISSTVIIKEEQQL